MNDEHRCEYEHCPWVQDAQNSNRYICLRCDREKNLDRLKQPKDESNGEIVFMLVAIAFLLVLLLSGCMSRQESTANPLTLRPQLIGL
jgi:hypothetical protein